jgi:hypothetical protein
LVRRRARAPRSCIWFAVANGPNGHLAAHGLYGLPWHQIYLSNFYTTLMMVMGDSVGPVTDLEKFFSSLVVLIGATMNATIFANVASYVAQIAASSAKHKARMESIVRATRLLRLPTATVDRIRSYFDYVWVRHLDFAGQEVMAELPMQLRKSVALQTHEHKLRTLALFAGLDERFLSTLATHLKAEVYLPDEYILMLGQRAHAAYFIDRGRVHIVWRTDNKGGAPRFLVRSDYFGELALFQANQHSYSARAMTHVDAYSLDRDDFAEVLREHPTEAVLVADLLHSIMPTKEATRAADEIYVSVGLQGMRTAFYRGRWRPRPGLAQKIVQLAHDPAFSRRLAEASVRSERRSCVGGHAHGAAHAAAHAAAHGGAHGHAGTDEHQQSKRRVKQQMEDHIATSFKRRERRLSRQSGRPSREGDGLEDLVGFETPPQGARPRAADGDTTSPPESGGHGARAAVAAASDPADRSRQASRDGRGDNGETAKALAQLGSQLDRMRTDMSALGNEVAQIGESQRRVEGLLLTLATKVGASTQI